MSSDPIKELYSKAYTEKLCVDCAERLGILQPFWAAIGFDRFYDIAKPELDSAWKHFKKLNMFKWIRCHEIFRYDELEHGDWKCFKDQKKMS